MPSEDLFVETESLFAEVAALRDRFGAVQEAATVPIVSLANPAASEALGLLADLANAVPSSMTTQLEIVSRLVSLGALDAIIADSGGTEDS